MKNSSMWWGVLCLSQMCIQPIAEATTKSTGQWPTQVTEKLPTRLMEKIQRVKNNFKASNDMSDDDYCELIIADKYLLAVNFERLKKIEDMEKKVDLMPSMKSISEIKVVEFSKAFENIELVREICDCYDHLRNNGRLLFWRRVAMALASR